MARQKDDAHWMVWVANRCKHADLDSRSGYPNVIVVAPNTTATTIITPTQCRLFFERFAICARLVSRCVSITQTCTHLANPESRNMATNCRYARSSAIRIKPIHDQSLTQQLDDLVYGYEQTGLQKMPFAGS